MTAATTNHHSLAQALDDFIAARNLDGLRPATLRFYRQQLGYFMGQLHEHDYRTVNDLNHYAIRDYLLSLKTRGLKDTSQACAWRGISAFCGFLHREGLLPDNPIDRVQRPRVSRRTYGDFKPEEIEALLDACTTARDSAIVLCLLDSGLRASELVNLRVGDVNFVEGTLKVREGKGGRPRTAYVSERTCDAISNYLSERGDSEVDDFLWLSQRTGSPLTADGLRQMLQRLGQSCRVDHCYPHRFRGTCATWMHRDGASIYAIRDVLGHRDISVLQRYLTLNDDDIRRAHHRHGPVHRLHREYEGAL